MSTPQPAHRAGLTRSIAAFGLVGLTATAVHVIVGLALVYGGLAAPFSANLVAFLTAFSVSYFGHRRFSFSTGLSHGQSLPRFAAVALLGLGMNQALVLILVERLGMAYAICLVFLVTLVPAVTYVLSRFWAFAGAPETDGPEGKTP